jgi:Ser/Thr protein kinase RdoA (MazF antagonist)
VGPPGADAGHAYWLRIYSRSRVPVTALEEEAAITVAIAREVEVAAAVPTSGGRFVATWSGGGVAYPALLYREVRGTAVASPSARQAANLGALLATVHAAGSRLAESRLAESRLAESRLAESRLAPWACVDAVALAASGVDHAVVHVRGCEIGEAELRSIVGDMRRIVERATLPRGFVHGDLHADNVRFDGDRPALLDFACCGEGPFAYDLACYWRKRVLSGSSDAPPDDWSSFVAGYSSVRALSEDELAVVPALACLRAIWVMCLPALPSEDWGAGWLADPEYVAAHLTMIRRFAGLAALSARGARA